MSKGVGTIQKKILLLLFGGLALGLSRSPRGYYRILHEVEKEWRAIDKDALMRSIWRLYDSRLIEEKENVDGSITMVLSEKGKKKALTYNTEKIYIKKPEKWDGRWRVIAFDIPERQGKARRAFSFHMKRIGCKEFQKSIFIHPYHCDDEIDFLIELYQLRPYVRKMVVETFDNELHFKKKFKLL